MLTAERTICPHGDARHRAYRVRLYGESAKRKPAREWVECIEPSGARVGAVEPPCGCPGCVEERMAGSATTQENKE